MRILCDFSSPAFKLTDLYQEGVRKNDKNWAGTEIQKQLLGK